MGSHTRSLGDNSPSESIEYNRGRSIRYQVTVPSQNRWLNQEHQSLPTHFGTGVPESAARCLALLSRAQIRPRTKATAWSLVITRMRKRAASSWALLKMAPSTVTKTAPYLCALKTISLHRSGRLVFAGHPEIAPTRSGSSFVVPLECQRRCRRRCSRISCTMKRAAARINLVAAESTGAGHSLVHSRRGSI